MILQSENKNKNYSLFGIQWWEIVTYFTAIISIASSLIWVANLLPNNSKAAVLQVNQTKINTYNLVTQSNLISQKTRLECEKNSDYVWDKETVQKINNLEKQLDDLTLFYDQNNQQNFSELNYHNEIQNFFQAGRNVLGETLNLPIGEQSNFCKLFIDKNSKTDDFYESLNILEEQEKLFINGNKGYRNVIILNI